MITDQAYKELRAQSAHIAQSAQELGWNSVVVVLYDSASHEQYFAAATTTNPDFESALLHTPATILDFFRPEAWRQSHFLISQSYLLRGHQNAMSSTEILSWRAEDFLVVPLKVTDEEIGWLVLANSTIERPFVLANIRSVEAFASLAAQTLRQTHLHQQALAQVDRLTILNEIGHTISHHLEMTELFVAIATQLRQVFTFDRASITLREEQRPHTQVYVQDKRQSSGNICQDPTSLETISFAQIIQHDQPFRLVSDLSEINELDEESELLATGIRSYVCLPLTMWRHVIGVLSLGSETPHTFDHYDIDFLKQIAEHASGAVWNALLHEVEQKRRYTAAALAELSKMVNSTLQMDEVLERALEQLAQVITYDTASILLVDGDNLKITACRGFEDPASVLGTVFRLEENNISHQVLQNQQVCVADDVQQISEWGHNRNDVEGHERIRAWIGAPLIVRDQSIGLLVLDKWEPNFYTDEDGETTAAFATQIATAIQNARLYQIAQEQRDRLAAILNDTTDSVIVIDMINHIWLLNPAAERSLKVQRELVVGQPVTVLGLHELSMALDQAQQENRPITKEIAGTNSMAFHASVAPVRDVGWVIVMKDITPLKELDRLRTEWVAAVSHDLKNPIQVIQLGAALMEIDGPLNELQLERISIIQRSAEQLSNLVTGVLDLARLEAGPSLRLTSMDLSNVITATLAEIEHLATKKQQKIFNDTPTTLPLIEIDGPLLQRALANLLGNAIKYTPVGGLITLRTTLHKEAVKIAVIDNGPGIPLDSIPQLFNRFYRVPGTNEEGTGLGLSIVKSIIEKHHGSIKVSSKEGQGSTFTIVLPLTNPITST